MQKNQSKVSLNSRGVEEECEGKVTHLISLRDLAECQQAEEKSGLDMEASRKLDPVKSDLMSRILHELRTPLHSIMGFTKLILGGKVPDPQTQEEFLNIIARQSEHLSMLLDELVDMPSSESDHFEVRKERVSAKDLLEGAVQELHGLATQKGIELSKSIPLALPEIEVDGKRLRQVVFNLVGNAIKFSEDGSRVNVKAEVKNKELLVQVTDQGVGIAEEAIPGLFGKFYQVKDPARVGGLGLGLYISKQIIEGHGGRIWVESTRGEGSTFSFALPLEQDW